jgi:hypothetical protein
MYVLNNHRSVETSICKSFDCRGGRLGMSGGAVSRWSTLGLVDGDTVESSNLHRQVLHRSKNVGKLKVDSAIESLQE